MVCIWVGLDTDSQACVCAGADPEDFTKYITNFVNDFETVLYSDKYQVSMP